VVSLFPAGGQLATDMVRFLTRGAISLTISSVLFLSWAASNFFVALSFAISAIFKYEPSFWRGRLAGLLLPLVGGLGLILVSIFNFGIGFLLRYIPDGPWENWLGNILPLILVTAIVFAIYRFLPPFSPGNIPAVLAAFGVAVGFDLLRRLLPVFIPRSSYEAIYGPLAGLALILLGFYIAMSILLVGAVILADFTSKNPQPQKGEIGVDHLEGRTDRG
jgi:membrane protein